MLKYKDKDKNKNKSNKNKSKKKVEQRLPLFHAVFYIDFFCRKEVSKVFLIIGFLCGRRFF